MKKISTIQKREKLNTVHVLDEKGNGGANHKYGIDFNNATNPDWFDVILEFQNGARHLEDSTRGITDQDLLEIVRHRLSGFNSGDLATRENTMALSHIEEALLWLNKRTEDRIERNVLGTSKF